MENFSACFGDVVDPRRDNARHDLHELLVIALCAMLCGGEDCTDMALFGQAKGDFLRRFLCLPHGIPAHDTFSRLFRDLDPASYSGGDLREGRRLCPGAQEPAPDPDPGAIRARSSAMCGCLVKTPRPPRQIPIPPPMATMAASKPADTASSPTSTGSSPPSLARTGGNRQGRADPRKPHQDLNRDTLLPHLRYLGRADIRPGHPGTLVNREFPAPGARCHNARGCRKKSSRQRPRKHRPTQKMGSEHRKNRKLKGLQERQTQARRMGQHTFLEAPLVNFKPI